MRALVAQAAASAARSGARLGVLVNNATRFVFGELTEVTDEQWDVVLGTNVKGCVLLRVWQYCLGFGGDLATDLWFWRVRYGSILYDLDCGSVV